jgi:hypothetical protein
VKKLVRAWNMMATHKSVDVATKGTREFNKACSNSQGVRNDHCSFDFNPIPAVG